MHRKPPWRIGRPVDDVDSSVIFTSRRLDRKPAPIERDKLVSSQTVRVFSRADISHEVHLVSNGKMIISRVLASEVPSSRRRAKKKKSTVMYCFLSSVINHRLVLNNFRFRAKQNIVLFFPDVWRFEAELVVVRVTIVFQSQFRKLETSWKTTGVFDLDIENLIF